MVQTETDEGPQRVAHAGVMSCTHQHACRRECFEVISGFSKRVTEAYFHIYAVYKALMTFSQPMYCAV